MKVLGKAIAVYVTYMIIGTGIVLGAKTAETIYENGLGDKVTKASKKLFQGK